MILRFIQFAALGFILIGCASKDEATQVDTSCSQTSCSTPVEAEEAAPTSVSLPQTSGPSGALTGDLAHVTYDAASQIFTVVGTGLNLQLNRFAVADYGKMLAMRDVAGIHNAYFGSGSGTQVVVYSGGTAGNVSQLLGFGRTGASDMPLTGSAQFSGDYAGFTTTRRINGKVRLDVSFANKTLSGRITDRVFRQRPDNVADVVNPLSALLLEETSIDANGDFSGVTAGGQIVNGQILWNPATGSFMGLIGGATGNEAVGTVAVTHKAPSGAEFEEVGGFLAVR